MISRKELFAEISNEAVCEDGEVVGYFVKNIRMDLLEQMLCSPVTVKLPAACADDEYFNDGVFQPMRYERDVERALRAAGIQVIEGEGQ